MELLLRILFVTFCAQWAVSQGSNTCDDIKSYLDSTYLKTASQAKVTEEENMEIAKTFIQEAIDFNFKLIMIRPNVVGAARTMIDEASSQVLVGTVIDFPEGTGDWTKKLDEAKLAIENGADELDYVINYEAFKKGEIELVTNEIFACTSYGLQNDKVVKWIIETAALDSAQIAAITSLIKEVVTTKFPADYHALVFVKSSTGFYVAPNNAPNGATPEAIEIMVSNSGPLSVKASGGVRTYEEALAMINLGVNRIGTSGARAIAEKEAQSGSKEREDSY